MNVRRFRARVAPLAAVLPAVLAFASLSAVAEPPEVRLPPDVTYEGADGSPGPVVFSHTTHVPLAESKCIACHPGTFSILGPTGRITHEEMDAGRSCGVCHDGAKASGVQDDCAHCHRMGDGS
jgi:c(7)-type cytochrome triheme protein